MRVETGPMQFDEDWKGIFIRGDNALMYYLPILQYVKEKLKDDDNILQMLGINNLIELFQHADQFSNDENLQLMKKFEDCVKK